MRKKFYTILTLLIAMASLLSCGYAYEHNVTFVDTHNQLINDPTFFVESLKYEEYPVNPGDSFDLWVKINNVGQQDATDFNVKINSFYPFVSYIDLNNNINTLNGIMNATISKDSRQETTLQTNEIILRYIVKVSESANEGTYNLALVTSYGNGISKTFYLPIEVSKTKTDFDLTLAKSSPFKTVLDISNSGSKKAEGVSVKILNIKDFNINSKNSLFIGNLNPGEFTTLNFDLTPKENITQMNLEISYSDISGVRNSINKTIVLNSSDYTLKQTGITQSKISYLELMYIIGGLILGILISFILFPRNKNKNFEGNLEDEKAKSRK